MDFFRIKERSKNGVVEIYPDFRVLRSKDLMVRSKNFYAIWDEERGLWSTDEYDVQRLVDKALRECAESKPVDVPVKVRYLADWSSKMQSEFRNYMSHISDNAHQLDESLTFLGQKVEKSDYVSRSLPYPLEAGVHDSYDELMSTLYAPEERAKIEWAIGAIISGDAKKIEKFEVLYGEAGTGKSTILKIIEKLFDGYYTTFEAKSLTSNNNAFSTEAFRSNPLVAIQHDGDLSKIEDNSKLNSIISHEMMSINEKYKPSYMSRVNCFLFMATNKPVKITDAKSGIIRRLIDVKPTGERIENRRYNTLISRLDFELSAIAAHCLSVYNQMGKNYYSDYRPLEMMYQTDPFFNYVEAYYHYFLENDGVTLMQAYSMYKTFCEETLVDFKLPRHKFREELKNYFKKFEDVARVDGKQVRSFFSGFKSEKFKTGSNILEAAPSMLVLDKTTSIFDSVCIDCPAQYATEKETPKQKWENVKTTLKDIDTSKVHYVRVPENHIVIDFDLKDETGAKSAEKNLEAANSWPPTYAEFSKGGQGIHLHYIYTGDVSTLKNVHSPGIEVKTFTGNSSLRRRFTKSNGLAIKTLVNGLALKEQKAMIDFKSVQSEMGIRSMIERNFKKEFLPGTKPSIDFIHHILEEAYTSGVHYDITDMRPRVLAFAANSTNQAEYCIALVNKMKFKSEDISRPVEYKNDTIFFFDVEVFPNLLVVVVKEPDKKPIKMFNPEPRDIEELLHHKLIGFNCRRYDNHILYARVLGYNNQQVYMQSQRIISKSDNAFFGEAYNISYTDIYDFSSKKQSLKKFEVDLHLHHKELGLPWDEPVPEEMWECVADYCVADVIATEAVFYDRSADWVARQILTELSGLTENDTTQQHTARIIFGDDRNPQSQFVYTRLDEMFPGYVFDHGTSTYKGVVTGEGGYVYAEPGMYENVALLDVASMHPTSIINLNLFGDVYTNIFKELVDVRLAIKNKEFAKARKMFGGKLEPFLRNEEESNKLAYALKIAINIVYGLTSASFPNKFRDPRNIDNIVAKRGALFMVDLQEEVQKRGFIVAHIKTDSIKIPNATPEIIEFVMKFGEKYGYTFEHEETYEKMCLVNEAVYIAKTSKKEWKSVGAQFSNPYVFKTLFSKEPIELNDMIEVKAVTSSLHLDLNEELPEGAHNYHFIGKVGAFIPVASGFGGGLLMREKDGKYYAATGSKGYRWFEDSTVKELNIPIDYSYHEKLVAEAKKALLKFGDVDWFIS